MKLNILLFLLGFFALAASAQDNPYERYKSVIANFPSGNQPNHNDSLYQLALPELTLPENRQQATLPAIWDNSAQPYLRPVFAQTGASCGQAAAVGYNFTYEMDLARGLSAKLAENQYPTHFTYNFENGGDAYFGVSYFYSFEMLRKCGNMNVVDYGGLADDGCRWISGYDKYYKGMLNRIEDVYTIKTNTAKGILALKNWVFNHIGESTTGGVASFYAGSPWNATRLPVGTPEAGRFVVYSFTVPAVHAMTIVGFNDSIRFDYNGDWQYTNDIDINGDGLVDVRDWEIGGFKFVNSYGDNGPSSLDSGFCYMMYKTLAESYDHGGIWNNAVHIVKLKPDYSPLLTMKIRLKHERRGSVRVRAGVSPDPDSNVPATILDFPIFNFQGGNHPMQHPGTDDTLKTIEFGLDITPLLSEAKENSAASFFLLVDENDPYAQASGSVEYLAVLDYGTANPTITEFGSTPVELNDNNLTTLKLVVTNHANKVKINPLAVQPFTAGQPFSLLMTASEGQPPYKWDIAFDYTKMLDNKPLPPFEGTKIVAALPSDSVMPVALGFGFPFYGKKYDTVYVNMNNGFLQFTKDKIPWPYFSEENLFLKSYKLIVPLTNQSLNSNNADEGAWYKTETGSAVFRWKLSYKQGETYFPVELLARLSADGKIVFNQSKITVPAYGLYHTGISSGNKQNCDLTIFTDEAGANQYNQTTYLPQNLPDELEISEDGLVGCKPADAKTVYEIPVRVSDYRNISNEKTFFLSSGIVAELKIKAGGDSIIHCGENISFDLKLTNLCATAFDNLSVRLRIDDKFIRLVDTTETVAHIAAQGSIVVGDAFRISASSQTPDCHVLVMKTVVSDAANEWNLVAKAEISAPTLDAFELATDKPDNGLLQPGEAGGIVCKVINKGHKLAEGVTAKLTFPDHNLTLISGATQSIGNLAPGQTATLEYQVKVSDSTLLGTQVPVILLLTPETGIDFRDTLRILIGKVPVLVVDMDMNHEAGPALKQLVSELGYLVDYYPFLPTTINNYQSLFVSLGRLNTRHILTFDEGKALMNYLDRGGNIYLESRNTWRDDPLTALQPRFMIDHANKFLKFDTLTGTEGSFTEGMDFANIGPFPYSQFYLLPQFQSFSLFGDNGYCVGVANDAGVYKTIGSIFEITSMQGNNDESTQAKLIRKYLEFFGVKQDVIGITEWLANEAGSVQVFPNPTFEAVNLSFNLDSSSSVSTSIFDLNGSLIAKLSDNKIYTPGIQTFTWNLCTFSGKKVSPGLYICRIFTERDVKIGKIVVK